MHKLTYWIVIILLLIPTGAVVAQQPSLVISTEDMNPEIKVDLNTGLSSFSKAITVTRSGGAEAAATLNSRVFDLVDDSTKAVIERTNISISPASLTKDQPANVTITVSNVTRVGTYRGDLKLWVDANTAAALTLKLTVEVKPKIDVKVPTVENVQLVRCGPLPCSLIGWLPDRMLGRERGLILVNDTRADLRLSLEDVLLRGDLNGKYIKDRAISLKLPDPKVPSQPLGAGKPTAIVLTLPETDNLVPDHYVGTLHFGLEDSEVRPTVNYAIDVRAAPWWALLALILGVVVGRLVNKMNSPEAIAQLKLMRRLYALHARIDDLPEGPDRVRLLAELRVIKQRINANENETVLTLELDKIEARLNLLEQLKGLQLQIAQVPNGALKQKLETLAELAIQQLREKKIAECVATIEEIKTLLETQALITDMSSAIMPGLLQSVRGLSEEGVKALAAKDAEPSRPRLPSRIVAFFAGTDLINAHVRFWVLRPLFFSLLLFLLVMVGLKTGYVDKSSFGSGGFYDYLGLFMWGLSADIAQKTIQNLSLPGARTEP